MIRALAAAFCAALVLAAQIAAAEEFRGPYKVAGETASGGAYAGSVAVAIDGKSYRLKWDRPSPLERRGYALRLDNVLGVVADDPSEDYGIVLYRVSGGHLEGIWSSDPGPPVEWLGAENLDGPAGLEGTFTISLGQNPGGSHYAGRVEIRKSGSIYLVDWYTPVQLRYIGTGVLMGNVFVVGYGERHRSGVAAYCLQSPVVIEGITGTADDSAIGAEILWRADVPPVEAPEARLARLRQRGTADCGVPVVQDIPEPVPPGPLIVTSR